MAFVSLSQSAEQPQGFIPLADDQPKRGFVPLDPERPSMAKTIALENPLAAIGESGLNLASQAIGLPTAGLAGLATEAGNALGLTDKKGADVVHSVGDAMTYEPRGQMGKMLTEGVTYPFQKLAEAGQYAGGKTLDATGSPALATAVDTGINALPMLVDPALRAAKGGNAARVAPEKIRPDTQASSVSPSAVSNVSARRGFSPIKEVVDGKGDQGAAGLAQHEIPMLQSGEQGLSEVRRSGDSSLPGVDEQLRSVPERHGASTEPETLARTPEREGQLRAEQLPLDDASRAGEAPSVLSEGDGLRAGNDGSRSKSIAGAAAQEFGDQTSRARPVAGRSGEDSFTVDADNVPRYDDAIARDGAAIQLSDGSIAQPHERGVANRVSAESREAPGLQATIDPNAGPLSRVAAMVVDQRRRADEVAAPTGFTPLAETQRAAQSGVEHSFEPGNSYTGFINDAPQAGAATTPASAIGRDAPIRREDILVPFAKDLGASIYSGRVKGKNTMGFFRRGVEEVRIKNHADLETTAHEMAHLIDSRVPAIANEWRSNKALRDQLKSISYDQSKVSEGFAEGVRLWMTQPEVLAERAPLVHEWLENFSKTNEKYGPTLLKAQEGMTRWFGQDAIDRARSKIGDHRPLTDVMDGLFDRFRQSVSDDLHGVMRMERELSGKLEPVGAYESTRLSRASASIADGAVRFGYPVKLADGSFTYRGKGLQDILKPVAEKLDDALLYFVGRSAMELRLQGREKLFTTGEIRGMLQLETPEARKAFAEYQAWNKGVLDFAEAQGVINPDTRRLWKRTEYLPMHRVSQPGSLKGKPGDWAGIKALTGGTENIKDVLGNMLGNAAQLIDVAVKNEARQKIAALANKPGGARFMVKIDPGSRPVKVSGSQVLDEMFKRYGIAVDGDAPAFFQFMTHGQPPAGGNVVAVLKGGKPVWYEVADPILYRSLQAIDRPPMDWVTKWLGLPKRVGQATITLTPDFMLANIARDTIMGAVMSRSGFRPVLESLKGMQLRITEDPLYKDFIANGGGLSSLYLDENHLRTKLEKFYNRQGIDYRTVLDAPDKLLSAVETIADAFEVSTRMGEYDRAIKAGEHPRHAAYQGREVSTDFAMRGDSKALGFLYDTVMFLKPAVVSMDRLYRGVAHDSNRAAIGMKTAMIALSSVGLYLLNRDDQRYLDLNDWDRDSNWHFFIGDQHFRYPKIWEIGAVASVAERTVEKLIQSDPTGLGKDFLRILSNTFNLNFMPQIIAPLAEQATNRNGFTHAPIETPGMESVQPFLRAKPNTSETMKALGMASRDLPESMQVNPVRAEALLRGYLNTWASYGLMLTDKAFFGDKQPEMRTDQLPVVRRFYSQEPPQHTKFETQFYDMMGEAKRLQGTLKELDRMGRPEIADQKELSPLAGEAKPLERAAKNLQEINTEMREIYRTSKMTPAEKRERLDSLTGERNALLKAAVTDATAAQRLKMQR